MRKFKVGDKIKACVYNDRKQDVIDAAIIKIASSVHRYISDDDIMINWPEEGRWWISSLDKEGAKKNSCYGYVVEFIACKESMERDERRNK